MLGFQELVKKYSEFINFPIYLWSSKEVDVEVPADEDEEAEKETAGSAMFFKSSWWRLE